MLGDHGSFRLEGTYLHKTTCEAAAKENNSGFGWYGKPATLGEWRPWEANYKVFARDFPLLKFVVTVDLDWEPPKPSEWSVKTSASIKTAT
jgi:hypothetical protein